MDEKMKALVTYGPYDYRYEEYPKPVIGKGEMLIKIKACSICAGDIKAFHGGIRIWGTTPENRYIETPCIGGHEFYGEVVEKADDVVDFVIGDIVVSEQIVPCNECEFCKQGTYWMCTRSAVYGFKQYANGGFAEYLLLNKDSINHKLPRDFSPEQSVLVEPIACGMHSVERAKISHSDVVVVAGLGAIGLSMVNIISQNLPKLVIGIDVKEKRLDMAKNFGADIVLNPMTCDVVKEIKRLTCGLGCDVYFEVSGNPKSVTQGLESLKNLGRYVQMGVFADEVKADWNIIGDGKELTVIGSHLSAITYEAVINGMKKGIIKTDGLISHSYALKDWQAAFEATEKDPSAVKIMLVP